MTAASGVFTEEAAGRLTRSLGAIDLQALRPAAGDGWQQYFDHYGIDFPSLQSGHAFGLFEAGGYRLACHCYRPLEEPRGTFFLLHGYFDHVGLYGHAIRFALDQGFAVLAFDLPGHGLSTGERASIDRFSRYREVFSVLLEKAQEAGLPGPWYILAQSMGGAIAMDYTLHAARHRKGSGDTDNPLPRRLFLLAPLLRPLGWRAVKLGYHLRRLFVSTIPRQFSENSSDREFLRFLREQDPLQPRIITTRWLGALIRWQRQFRAHPPCDVPVSIAQGDNDGTVDWRYNLPKIRGKFPDTEVVTIPGGRHHLINEAPELRQQFLQPFATHL